MAKKIYSVNLDEELIEEIKPLIGWCGYTSFSELVEAELRNWLSDHKK